MHGVRGPALQDVRREVLQFSRTVQIPVERGLRGQDVQHPGDQRREELETFFVDQNDFTEGNARTPFLLLFYYSIDRTSHKQNITTDLLAARLTNARFVLFFFFCRKTDRRIESKPRREQADQDQRAEDFRAVQEEQRTDHIEHERYGFGGDQNRSVHRVGRSRIPGSFRTVAIQR